MPEGDRPMAMAREEVLATAQLRVASATLQEFEIDYHGHYRLLRSNQRWQLLRDQQLARVWPGRMPPLRALAHALHHISSIKGDVT